MLSGRDFQLEPVPADLKARLNQEVKKTHVQDRRSDVASLMNSERFVTEYDACVWWDGCYYCRDERGSWYQIRCGFF
jgi:hypothetical protein